MDYFTLKPTKENIVQALNDNLLKRNGILVRFLRILDAVENNMTIAIDGAWGSGKTFFVKQAELVLNYMNPLYRDTYGITDEDTVLATIKSFSAVKKMQLSRNHLAVYYDAWANDNAMDPIISILYQAAIQQCNLYDLDKYKNIREILEEIVDALPSVKGISPAFIKKLFEHTNITSGEAGRVYIQERIKKYFNQLKYEQANRIVIFIDELDRCRPTFAVQLLETIKHYFECEDITFVFSTNLHELGKTIECYYGAGFNSTRYLDRFFDLRLELRKPMDLTAYLNSIKRSIYSVPEIYGLYFAKALGFEIREITNYLKTIKIALNEYGFGIQNRIEFYTLYGVVTPLLLALKMYNLNDYFGVLEGRGKDLFVRLLSNLNGYESDRFYNYLLDDDESYRENDKEYSLCTKQEKIEQLYDLLFPISKFGNNSIEYLTIGNMRIDPSMIEEMINNLTLLSDFNSLSEV